MRLQTVFESEIDPDTLIKASNFLSHMFRSPSTAERGWTRHPPYARALIWDEGQLVAHGAICRLATVPSARAYGMSDLAVDPQYRREGIGRWLCEYRVELALHWTPQLLLVAAPAMSKVYRKLGFVPAPNLWTLRDEQRWQDPHWLARWTVQPPASLQLLREF